MDLDHKVCYCFHVTRRKLVNFIRLARPRVPSQLSECGGAGTGCGWCIPFLKQLYHQAAEGGVTELESLSPQEYERRRAAYVRSGKGTPPPGATPLPESPLSTHRGEGEQEPSPPGPLSPEWERGSKAEGPAVVSTPPSCSPSPPEVGEGAGG